MAHFLHIVLFNRPSLQVEVEDPALRPEDISALIEEALRLPGDKKRKADAAGT